MNVALFEYAPLVSLALSIPFLLANCVDVALEKSLLIDPPVIKLVETFDPDVSVAVTFLVKFAFNELIDESGTESFCLKELTLKLTGRPELLVILYVGDTIFLSV
ncbi:hypothetical protein ACG92U_08935 [Leuconostoc citreum]